MLAKKEKSPNPDRLPIGKFVAWRLSGWSLSANFIIMGYITIYCTDTLLMPAALVGALLLASKLLDAFGELYAGFLIDRCNFKMGKGRPWELSFIGLWICTIILFSAPASASLVVKSIWVFFMYMMVMSVFQTLIAAAGMPYTVRAFANKRVVVKVQSFGGIAGTLLSSIVSISFPQLMGSMTTQPGGWTKLMLLYGTPLLLFGLSRFLFVKEVYQVEENKTERVKFSDILQVMKSNKYIWIVCAITLTMQIMMGMGAATYYFTYIVGDIGKYGTLQMMTLILLISMFFFPAFIKKFSVSTLIGVGALLGVAGNIINFFAGANMTLLIIGFIVSGLASLAPSYLVPVMILDCAKFNEWKGNRRMDATMSAVNNFGTNLGSGIGSALIGMVLGVTGYIGGAQTQTPAAMFAIRSLYSIVPLVLYLVMFILTLKYDLEKRIPQMEKEMAAK